MLIHCVLIHYADTLIAYADLLCRYPMPKAYVDRLCRYSFWQSLCQHYADTLCLNTMPIQYADCLCRYIVSIRLIRCANSLWRRIVCPMEHTLSSNATETCSIRTAHRATRSRRQRAHSKRTPRWSLAVQNPCRCLLGRVVSNAIRHNRTPCALLLDGGRQETQTEK